MVVSPDREVWRRADAMGCRVVEEPPGAGDLNSSLAAAAGSLGNGSALLVVAADLPLASAAGLGRCWRRPGRRWRWSRATTAAAPTCSPGATRRRSAPSFGPGSAARHLAVPGAVRVDEPGLALDVDTAGDLRLVAGRLDPASVTARRLRRSRYAPALTGSTEEA